MSTLPTISVVVPNYNGGATIAATLQSLVDQNYPGLEIIVFDGGSKDNSVDVIRRFEPHLAYWVSEKDKGQSDAINKGFARATGEVVNWLCSDDVLKPGALMTVGKLFADRSDIDVLTGGVEHIFTDESQPAFVGHVTDAEIDLLPCCFLLPQPSTFYRRKLLNRPGPLDVSLHYTMDMELWGYFKSQNAKWAVVDDILSTAYISGQNKCSTGGSKIIDEIEDVYRRYSRERVPLTFWQRHLRHPLEKWRVRHPGGIHYVLRRPLEMAITGMLAPFYGRHKLRHLNWSNFVAQS